MQKNFVVLRDINQANNIRRLTASLSNDGTLTIEGQDIGDDVERFFGEGNREYEWIWTLHPEEATRLRKILDAGNSILDALANRFSDEDAADLASFLSSNQIHYETWSRIGD